MSATARASAWLLSFQPLTISGQEVSTWGVAIAVIAIVWYVVVLGVSAVGYLQLCEVLPLAVWDHALTFTDDDTIHLLRPLLSLQR